MIKSEAFDAESEELEDDGSTRTVSLSKSSGLKKKSLSSDVLLRQSHSNRGTCAQNQRCIEKGTTQLEKIFQIQLSFTQGLVIRWCITNHRLGFTVCIISCSLRTSFVASYIATPPIRSLYLLNFQNSSSLLEALFRLLTNY